MELTILKNIGEVVGKHLAKNGSTYVKVGGSAVVASAATVAVCHVVYKQLETKHRKEDAEKYKAEFNMKLQELEERHKHNEFILKMKVNDLCKEYGIDPVFEYAKDVC